MEGEFFGNDELKEALVKSGILLTPKTIDLLTTLQCTHDDYPPDSWKLTLMDNAIEFFDVEMDEAVSIVNSLIEV